MGHGGDEILAALTIYLLVVGEATGRGVGVATGAGVGVGIGVGRGVGVGLVSRGRVRIGASGSTGPWMSVAVGVGVGRRKPPGAVCAASGAPATASAIKLEWTSFFMVPEQAVQASAALNRH